MNYIVNYIFFAVIDFSQNTFEMTVLCHSETPAEESVIIKDLVHNVFNP